MWNEVFYIGVDPIIFKLGPITVGWYGLMVALAVVTVVSWVAWQAKKTKTISADTILTGAMVGIPSGIVFSKILHLIDQWRYYLDNPGRILSGEGLTIWGAVLGATIGVWAYSKISKGFRFTLLGDLIAPGIILSQAIGRVGCTFNGCCYGLESHSWCAVIYTNPNTYAPLGIPVLPTMIFEIFFDLALFGLLFYLRGKLKPEGSLFMVYFAFYGAWRFGIEFIREGTPFFGNMQIGLLTDLANMHIPVISWLTQFFLNMHQAQFIGLVVMLITIPQIIWKTRWIKKETAKLEEAKAE